MARNSRRRRPPAPLPPPRRRRSQTTILAPYLPPRRSPRGYQRRRRSERRWRLARPMEGPWRLAQHQSPSSPVTAAVSRRRLVPGLPTADAHPGTSCGSVRGGPRHVAHRQRHVLRRHVLSHQESATWLACAYEERRAVELRCYNAKTVRRKMLLLTSHPARGEHAHTVVTELRPRGRARLGRP